MWLVLTVAAAANVVLVNQVLDLQARLEESPHQQVQQVVAAVPAMIGAGGTNASYGAGCRSCTLETTHPPLSSQLSWPLSLGFASIFLAAVVMATLTSRLRAHSGLIEEIWRRRQPLQRLAGPHPLGELSTDLTRTNQLMVELNNVAGLINRASGDSAHALRSPLAVVKIAIQRVRAQTSADRTMVIAALDAAEANTDRMFEIIDSSQRLDEETAMLIVAPRRTEELGDIVRDSLHRRAPQLKEKSLRVSACLQDRALVHASEDMLEELLDDLLRNAAAASPQGAAIDVALVVADRVAVLRIEDEGAWISPDDAEQACERDYMRSEPLSAGRLHNGLVLRRRSYYVANRNADLLGGHLGLENRAAGGIVVVVRLPLA